MNIKQDLVDGTKDIVNISDATVEGIAIGVALIFIIISYLLFKKLMLVFAERHEETKETLKVLEALARHIDDGNEKTGVVAKDIGEMSNKVTKIDLSVSDLLNIVRQKLLNMN